MYNIDNPVTGKDWPPPEEIGDPISPKRCRDIMHHLNVQEMERMRKQRPFPMPEFHPGDLLEVRYELSRVLGVRVVHSLKPRIPKVDPRPPSRNYRYMWHYFVRGKYSKGKRLLWKFHMPQRPGIMSLEPRIRRELANIRRRYQMQREEAQLPSYIFPGPYHITRRQSREVKAERLRRMLIYAWDERQQREQKKKRLQEKHKWGVYKINKEPKTSALTDLPSYHPLNDNLPK